MTTIFRRLRYFLGRSRHDADLREEIEAHRALRQDALERDGLAPDDAAHASRRALGNVALAVDDARDVWTIRTIDSVSQDIRTALRGLRKSPGFALVAIGTLALGIGANTALFSIFSSLILRPLPVRDPGSLALLTNGAWSYPIWEEIRVRETELFDGAFAWSGQSFDLSSSGQSDLVDGAFVSGRLFDVLGVTAIRGRMIAPADDGGAAPDGPVAVISHRLWRQRFGGADDVAGRRLTVQRIPFTIVGVMPPGFFGPDVGRMTDVMLPFAAEPLIRGQESRLGSASSWWLQVMVRLKPVQTLEQATAALRSVQPQILESATRSNPSRLSEPLTLAPAATGNSSLRTRFETPLFAMVVAVGLVLLVACANIASLLLARALARRRELSVRLALGSSAWRIARLLLIESLIVAVTGAALGLMFASWSSALLVQQLSTWQRTVSLDLAVDWRVLAFTAALACLSAVVAGVAPVFGLKSVGPAEALKDAGRGIAGDRRFSVRGTLVVAQVSVSLVLVVAAGLFLRTFASLNQLPLGFVPEPLLVAELNLQAGGGPPEERGARVERLRDAAAAVPGVRSASVSAIRLLTGGGWASGLVGVGDGPISRSRPPLWLNATTPGWFDTMGVPLRRGRDFEAGDRVGGRPVAIVNEAFVRRYLPGVQPIGQRVRLGFDADTRHEIVGVVGDAVYTTPREGMLATMYVPVAQQAPETFWPAVLLTINVAAGRRAAVERDIAAALTQVDPTVVFTFGTFDQLVEATVAQERLIAMLSAFFGGLALLLAAIGLYGVVAHARQRGARVESDLHRHAGHDEYGELVQSTARGDVHTAMFDAYNGVDQRYTPIFVHSTAPNGASGRAAVIAAAYTALGGLFPAQQPALDERYAASLAALSAACEHGGQPHGRRRWCARRIERGVAWGAEVAYAVLGWRANDGFTISYPPFAGGTTVGQWRPVPPATAMSAQGLAFTDPFVLVSNTQLQPEPPRGLGSSTYEDFNTVKSLGRQSGSARTDDHTAPARFWEGNASVRWNQAANQIARANHLSVADSSRLLAVLNIAMADTAFTVWSAKRYYGANPTDVTWRPATSIPLADIDGNPETAPDPSWVPLITTPSHPEYPAGHPSLNGAAATILLTYFRRRQTFTLTTNGLPDRTYTSITQARSDGNNARVWGGMHYPSTVDISDALGEATAKYVNEHAMKRLRRAE